MAYPQISDKDGKNININIQTCSGGPNFAAQNPCTTAIANLPGQVGVGTRLQSNFKNFLGQTIVSGTTSGTDGQASGVTFLNPA